MVVRAVVPLFKMIKGLSAEMAHAVEKELRSGIMLEQRIAAARNSQLSSTNRRKHRSVDGLGQHVARIDPTSYHYWMQKVGKDCWKDKQFVREYQRDNPQSKVASTGTKLQFGYAPVRKYTKTYAPL